MTKGRKGRGSAAVEAERPRGGGSYVRDRRTGKLERVEMTASPPIGGDVAPDSVENAESPPEPPVTEPNTQEG